MPDDAARSAAARPEREVTSPQPPNMRDRFTILRQLGKGGMGIVYEAIDRMSGRHVAVKTMRATTGDALLRFKHEFRALQDIHHRNLITLGDLMEEAGQWWFSMELVHGVNFLSYVRPARGNATDKVTDRADTADARSPASPPAAVAATLAAPEAPGALDATLDPSEASSLPTASSVVVTEGNIALDEGRLRATLLQLAEGLHALHLANKVHRDVKPENILVTQEGRLVLLDFGLVSEQKEDESAVVGTVLYMAPEQAAGRPVGPEADWYSVGVLLYEALVQRCPFEGTALEILADKQYKIAPPPRRFSASVPPDLDELCVSLLHPEPGLRAGYADIRQRLGPVASLAVAQDAECQATALFVGRRDELAELHAAYRGARAGHGHTVLLHGESGVGKSTMMRKFQDELARDTPGLVTLMGRCYEREDLPYKAVDGIIDSLSRYLRRLPESQVLALLPRRAVLLLQAFPVLHRIPALAAASAAGAAVATVADPKEQRERVFAALRELFGRLAERHPVLLLIDDLQWTDTDSLALLANLMNPPDEPQLLLLATVRPETRVFRRTWLDPTQARRNVRHLHLSTLSPKEASELAQHMLKRVENRNAATTEQLVAESAGHPMLLEELVRHAASSGAHERVRLEDALWSRIALLPAPARRLLELSVVMGSPLSTEVAAVAGGLSPDELGAALSTLRTQHLLRTTVQGNRRDSGAEETKQVEPYHDRIRGAVAERLSAEQLRAAHARLASALEHARDSDPELLFFHCEACGQLAKAGRYALQAADKAAAALAFDRAAGYYRRALELLRPTGEEREALQLKLAAALVSANRAFEGAEALEQAALTASPRQASRLRQRAGDQYLRGGYFQRGFALMRKAFRDLRLTYHSTTFAAIATLIIYRLWLGVRGLGLRERRLAAPDPDELSRIDALLAYAIGVGSMDPGRGSEASARALARALRLGDPERSAISLALLAVSESVSGTQRSWERGVSLLARARSLLERTESPYAQATVTHAEGTMHYLAGMFRRAGELLAASESLFVERCSGVSWELGIIRTEVMGSAYLCGDLRQLKQRLPQLLQDAEERKDLFFSMYLGVTALPVFHLLDDQPERARHESSAWLARWSYSDQGIPRMNNYWWLVNSLLYEGDADGAYRQARMRKSFGLRLIMAAVQAVRIWTTDLLGRSALYAAQEPGALKARLLQEASRSMHRLRCEQRPWAIALASCLDAGIAAAQGELERSKIALRQTAEQFDVAGMRIHAVVARRRHGQLLSGDAGRREVAACEEQLRAEGITNPARWSRMILPGSV